MFNVTQFGGNQFESQSHLAYLFIGLADELRLAGRDFDAKRVIELAYQLFDTEPDRGNFSSMFDSFPTQHSNDNYRWINGQLAKCLSQPAYPTSGLTAADGDAPYHSVADDGSHCHTTHPVADLTMTPRASRVGGILCQLVLRTW